MCAALDAGVQVSKQGLAQRFSAASAEMARCVLARPSKRDCDATERLGVVGTVQGRIYSGQQYGGLPKELGSIWPGCGSWQGSSAALKLHTRLEVSSGQLGGPILVAGREHDSRSPFQSEDLPQGALRMGDLGFFSLKQFKADSEKGVWWLSRYKVDTCLYDLYGQPLDLLVWLARNQRSGGAADPGGPNGAIGLSPVGHPYPPGGG